MIQFSCRITFYHYNSLWFSGTKMITQSIKILNELAKGTSDARLLRQPLGIKEWQFNEHIKNLVKNGYVEKNDGIVSLQKNVKTALFVEISKKLDIELLLHDSNELIFSLLSEPLTIDELLIITGLSPSTVYRSISDFESLGVIKKEQIPSDVKKLRTEKIQIDNSKTDLEKFSKIIKTDLEKLSEPLADIIYKDKTCVLKKVQSNKTTEGELTAFSLFPDYKLNYNSPANYYVKQDTALEIHDILIHSVLVAYHEKDKQALAMSIIFYLKYKENFDNLKLRKMASHFNIISIWLDIERFLRRYTLKNPELFLSWEEFFSQTKAYNITSIKFFLQTYNTMLYEKLSTFLKQELKIFILSDDNLRINYLREDAYYRDIIVETFEDYNLLKNILITKFDYKEKTLTNYSSEDYRLFPDTILTHSELGEISIFVKKIMHVLSLSSHMIRRAGFKDYGFLKIGLLSNEHVFLLKAIASRMGEIHDTELLISTKIQPNELYDGDFDWKEVWKEICHQEQINSMTNFTTDVFYQISILQDRNKIDLQFLNKLKRHVIDGLITSSLYGGKISLNEIVNSLTNSYISEKIIRNRINSLEKKQSIKKQTTTKGILLSLTKIPSFSVLDWKINLHNLKTYLDWRFPLREKSPEITIKKFVDELNSFEYKNIGELDDLIVKSLDVLFVYERDHFLTKKRNLVGAARICVRLNKPDIGDLIGYHVSDLEKYRDMMLSGKIEDKPSWFAMLTQKVSFRKKNF